MIVKIDRRTKEGKRKAALIAKNLKTTEEMRKAKSKSKEERKAPVDKDAQEIVELCSLLKIEIVRESTAKDKGIFPHRLPLAPWDKSQFNPNYKRLIAINAK